METLQTEIEPAAASSTDKVLFRKQVQHELDESDKNARGRLMPWIKRLTQSRISAYNDTLVLLEMLCNYKLPMPEVSWAEDGML